MATVLKRCEFEQDGISFTMLTGLFAIAVAVEAYPTVGVSELAARLVSRLRADGVLTPDHLLGLVFRGTTELDEDVLLVLRDLSVYVVVNNLQDSAVANAEAFLDEVEVAAPEASEIAAFRRRSINRMMHASPRGPTASNFSRSMNAF